MTPLHVADGSPRAAVPGARVRLPGLDALRGIAVLLVMGRHAVPDALPGAGVVGVVMFFALSGYLISGLLEDELDGGQIRLRRFYLRRLLRLGPALITLLVGLTVVTLLADPLSDRHELGRTWLFALTWTGDLPFGHASEATFHLWTLALEEQFYLVWPWLLVLGRRWRRPGLVLGLGATVCLLGAVATTIWLRHDIDLGYSLPTSWALCFVIGAAARHYGPASAQTAPWVLGLAAGAVLVILSVADVRGHWWTYPVAAPLVACATVVLVLQWRERPLKARGLRWLIWLGVLSYGAYLWNYPLTLWLRPVSEVAASTLAPLMTIILAWASHRWVETPALRLGRARWGLGSGAEGR